MHWLRLKEHLALLIVSVIYGVNYVIAKEVMPEHIRPKGFILLRVVTAVVFFFLLSGIITNERVRKEDWLRLFLCGIFGVALNQLLFFEGLNLTAPINASLVMITTPISVLLLDRFFNNEKITLLKAAGILLGATGALLTIFGRKDFVLHASAALGDFMIFLNAFFYAVYLVLVKPLMKHYHPLTVVTWVFVFGMLIVVPIGWNDLAAIRWQTFNVKVWLCLIFVLFFTTILAYLLNIYAMKKVSPALVGIYIYVQPVVAAAVAVFFGKDQLTGSKVAAAALIFVGIYLTSMRAVNTRR